MAVGQSDREWHEIVKAADVPEAGLEFSLEADAAECSAAADRLGVLEIAGLSLNASVKPWRKGGLRVDGQVRARVTQACVITLDPVEELVEESYRTLFSAESDNVRVNAEAEIVIDALDDDDPPEILQQGEVDLCQIAIEHLALGIDPYPRKDGVSLEDQLPPDHDGTDGSKKKPGAFDALNSLKTVADKG